MNAFQILLVVIACVVAYLASRPGAPPSLADLQRRFPLARSSFQFVSSWPPASSTLSNRKCRKFTETGRIRRCTRNETLHFEQRLEPARFMLTRLAGAWKEVGTTSGVQLLWLDISLENIGRGVDFSWGDHRGFRINRFPMIEMLNRKDTFAQMYERRRVPHEARFHPKTVTLPADRSALESVRFPALLKPPFGGKGHGIVYLESPEHMPADVQQGTVLQEYIRRPMLISGGRKFSLRLYVVLLQVHPQLRAMVHRQGVVKMASRPLDSLHGHVINQDEYWGQADHNSTRWRLRGCFDAHWEARHGSFERFWHRSIKPVLYRGLDVAAPLLRGAATPHCAPEGQCFQVLGVDLDIDEDQRVWWIEANVNVGLGFQTEWERLDKAHLLRDVAALTGLAFDMPRAQREMHVSRAALEASVAGGFQLLSKA